MRRPEGPHAVAFGKDLKIDNMSKSWGRIVVPKASIDSVVGGVPLGCLDRNNSHVVSVLGAIPVEVSAWQALPYSPSLARDMAVTILCLVLRCLGWRSLGVA